MTNRCLRALFAPCISALPVRLGAAVLALAVPWPLLAQDAGSTASTSASAVASEPQEYKPYVGQPGKDVVWVPTPDEVVEKMLDMAAVTDKDVVVDLGSGDGKIAIAAARRGAKARGIEFNPNMVALSRRHAQQAGVQVEFVQGDIFKTDFRRATVVTMYLLPELNVKLRPILLKMAPGTRITSHSFQMGDWEPDETAVVGSRTAYLWRVPAPVRGAWSVTIDGRPGPALALQQTFQKLQGTATVGGERRALSEARIDGDQVRFTVADGQGGTMRFEGRADTRGRMQGTVTDAQGARPFSAVRR